MPCYYPWKPDASLALAPNLKLPCGRCQGCRLERSRQWAVRCVHESKMHRHNAYITLTYDDEHLPANCGLHHRHWQLFAKKLRNKRGSFRYYMAGEYGDTTGRPHYHACLFGIDFPDKYRWRKNDNGDQLYRSGELERLWPHGNAELGAVTFQSAAYVARYVMKKITGNLAAAHYTWIDQYGEIHQRKPEYNEMSRRPGIGRPWFDKYHNDVYPSDQVISNGNPAKPPRYYDNLLKRADANLHQKLKRQRTANIDPKEQTPKRLKAKETVQAARLARLQRTL